MQLPEHWLVVRLSALGDVALTTGVLERWHRERNWRFTFLTLEQWAPVLKHHPAIDHVIGVRREDLSAAGLLRLCRKLSREMKGSGLLDLHGTLRSRVLGALWKGKVLQYPKFSMERRAFLRSKGKLFREKLLEFNVPQRYALAVEPVAPPRSELLPVIHLAGEEKNSAMHRVAPMIAGSGKTVALHPYSTHLNKAWKPEYWSSLAETLVAAGHNVLIMGRGDSMASVMPSGVHDLTNATSLRETCALLGQCDMLVTGDSGPMHLAGGVGTPVIALFGPTHAVWGFYPEGPDDIILEADEPCRPCSLHGSKPCPHGQACMASITPQRVVEAVNRMPRRPERA